MNITTAFRSLLTMLAAFFSAGEKIGRTLDNLATVAVETSESYVDAARAERLAKLALLDQAAAATTAAIEKASTAPAKATAKA